MKKHKTSVYKTLNILAILVLLLSMISPFKVEAKSEGQKLSQSVLQSFDQEKMVTYLVKFNDRADTKGILAQMEKQIAAENLSAKDSEQVKNDAVIQGLKETAEKSQESLLEYLEEEKKQGSVEDFHSYYVVNGLSVTSTKEVAQKIASFAEVEKILPNEKRYLITKDSNPVMKLNSENEEPEWNIDRIGAPALWEQGIGGSGIVIASIDSGVQWDHPALKESYRGYDLATGEVDHSYSWYDPVENSSEPMDDVGHGTHVTGTMVGQETDGTSKVGVAPEAEWIAVRAFTAEGETSDEDLLKAAEWVLLPTDEEGNERPDLRPDIVNNSWGGGAGLDEWYRDIVQEWRNVGILPVFAAGNISMFNPGGEGSVENPANYPESFAVGATDEFNKVTAFSLRGPSPYDEIKPDVAAPGAGIYSAIPGNEYGDKNGTSMATPAVSGLAALLLSYQSDLSVDELEDVLKISAIPLTDEEYEEVPNNGYGHGLVDGQNAIAHLENGLGTVEGIVIDSAGKEIVYPGDLYIKETGRYLRTKEDNSFSTLHPTGSFTLEVDIYGYEVTEVPVEIIKDEITTIEVELTEIEKGSLQGSVIDEKTDQDITNATLTLKEDAYFDPVRSNETGDYTLENYIGDYTLLVTAPGYKDKEVSVELTRTNQELDINLEPYYTYPGDELIYDNGVIDNGSMYFAGGAGWAVKMTLPEGQESGVVTEGLFAFIDKSFGDPADLGDEFAVEVWDASGPDGEPGKQLTPRLDAKIDWDEDWTVVDLREENIKVDKEFYMVYYQTMEYPNAPGLATDNGEPYYNRSLQYMDGQFYPAFEDDGNYMIRANVDYEMEEPQITSPEDGYTAKEASVEVEGISSPTTTVQLTNNGEVVDEQEVQEDGAFIFDAPLQKGENELQVFTIVNGVKAKESNLVTVIHDSEEAIDRLSGKQRYHTAISISQEAWEDGSLEGEKVVLARGDDFADALAGVPLAYALDSPILLWPSTDLNNYEALKEEVEEEIERLGNPEIIILGDKEAISTSDEKSFGQSVRLSGKTRVDTAVAIANYLVDEGFATGKDAVIVNGYDFPDALSIAPYAAREGLPILLTHQDELTEATEEALSGLGEEKIKVESTYVIGGTLAVAEEVLKDLPNPERLSGTSRYDTNEAVINHFAEDFDHVYVTTGKDYADALSGSVLAAKQDSTILLIQETNDRALAKSLDFFEKLELNSATVLGGHLAISDELKFDLEDLLK